MSNKGWTKNPANIEKVKIWRDNLSASRKGIVFSEKHVQNLSLAKKDKPNPKQSEIMKESYATGKRICWQIGKTKETDERIRKSTLKGSVTRKQLYAKGQIDRSNIGKCLTSEGRKTIREKRNRQVFPKKDSVPEIKLQKELTEREIPFEKHIPIVGQPDIAFPSVKIAVFCDGDYWHNTEKAKVRDPFVNAELKKDNWLVLRYWEHEINANPAAVVDEIEDCLLARGTLN